MQGTGLLIIHNCDCFLSGDSLLTVNNNTTTLTGEATLYVFPSTPCAGNAVIPSVASSGGNTTYAFASQEIPAFTSQANNDYVPPPLQYGYAVIQPFTSFAITEEAAGTASTTLPAFYSVSGNCAYAYSYQVAPALRSFALFSYNDQLLIYSQARLTSTGKLTAELFLDIISSISLESHSILTVVSSINILGNLLLSSYSALSGTYTISLLGALSLQGVSLFQEGTLPVFLTNTSTWALNIDTNASSQYDYYSFTSFFKADGKDYGACKDGIYELTGDTDAGNKIEALINFGRSDFGSALKKRIHNVYLGVSSAENMRLKVDADEQVFTYEARNNSDAVKNTRITIGKNLVGNYWDLTLMNKHGCDFDLEMISFDPINLSRKI